MLNRASSTQGWSFLLIRLSTPAKPGKRSKGLTENALAALRYNDTIVFEPGLLTKANRPTPRPGERLATIVIGTLFRLGASLQVDVRSFTLVIVHRYSYRPKLC